MPSKVTPKRTSDPASLHWPGRACFRHGTENGRNYASTSHEGCPLRNPARSEPSEPLPTAISASGAEDHERPNATGNPASRRSHASASRMAAGVTAGEQRLTACASSTASERAEAALMVRSTESTAWRRSCSPKARTSPVTMLESVSSSAFSTKEQRTRSPFGREGRICPCGSRPGCHCRVARTSTAPATRVEILPAGSSWRSATVRRSLRRTPAESTAALFAVLSGRPAPRTGPLPGRSPARRRVSGLRRRR